MLSHFRLITFDVTDTLLKFKSSPGKQYAKIGAMYGVLGDNKTLSDNFKVNWRKMTTEHPNFGLHSGIGWENWWKKIVHDTFKDSVINVKDKQLDTIAQQLIHIYKTSTCWQHCHGALNLLSYIRSKDIPMGIISNFDPRLNEMLSNVKLKHFFNFVLTSYEFGAEKPDKMIFEGAMSVSKINNLKPDECLHIGDKPLLDYYGAKNSGWHAILINNPDEIKKKHPELDSQHLYTSLYHLHKYFIETSKETLSQQTV